MFGNFCSNNAFTECQGIVPDCLLNREQKERAKTQNSSFSGFK